MIDFSVEVVASNKLEKYKILSKDIKYWCVLFLRTKQSDISQKTIKSYIQALKTFYLFAKQYDEQIGLSQVSDRFINHYIMWYQIQLAKRALQYGKINESTFKKINRLPHSKKLGPYCNLFDIHEQFESSISQRIVVLKAFFSYISAENREQVDLTKAFNHAKKIKINEKMTDYLTAEELEKTIKYAQKWPDNYKGYFPRGSERTAYRNSMLLLMYCLTGARTEELLWVRGRDIKLRKDDSGEEFYIVDILKGKGGKRRKVAFKKHYLQRHIEYMNSELPDENYFYSSTFRAGKYTKNHMTDKAIRDFQNTIMKLQGIDKTGLHTIRRAYATVRIGKDKIQIAEVAKELGNTIAILEKHYFKNNEDAIIRNKKDLK